ncbi:MAG TPA: WecB/TagA/CpsF family glycosyltransferase [Bacteroidota bacterium]|nr:WecB/TagA/CpsF family glycosyltransferase [Bacteroidota bacterium]
MSSTFKVDDMPAEYVDILGISYSTCDEQAVLERIAEAVRTRKPLTIVQPHFFHAVLGRNDRAILGLYRRYDLAIPDGYGMHAAGKFLYGEDKAFRRVSNGTDLYEILLKEADRCGWKIFFLGDTEQTLQALHRTITARYPGLIVAGTHHGFGDLDDENILSAINASGGDILMIGMGTPRQDAWLWKHYEKLRVPVMMTVGAGIGFMSGRKKRAPEMLRTIHAEWLFRLFQEPRRLWRRYFLGIPKFMVYIVLQKVRQS